MKRRVLPKTASFHTLFIKKTQNSVVLKALWVSFFPWTRKAREEEEDFFFLYHRHLSLQKDADTTPTCPKLSTC
jgi:hypothetical protein